MKSSLLVSLISRSTLRFFKVRVSLELRVLKDCKFSFGHIWGYLGLVDGGCGGWKTLSYWEKMNIYIFKFSYRQVTIIGVLFRIWINDRDWGKAETFELEQLEIQLSLNSKLRDISMTSLDFKYVKPCSDLIKLKPQLLTLLLGVLMI